MHHQLDTTNLICPMPLLKLKLFIKKCSKGDSIEQFITDPQSIKDIPKWLNSQGYQCEVKYDTKNNWILNVLIV